MFFGPSFSGLEISVNKKMYQNAKHVPKTALKIMGLLYM